MPAAATDAHARQRRAVNGCARPCQRVLAAGLSPPPRTHRRLWKRHGRRASLRSEESLALGVAPVVAAHDAFGFLQSDAACGTRTRCGSSGWPPLSPPSRHRSARSPDCWRGGAPSTSGVTEPPGSGREHAPIAAVGRRKKLDCRMGLTEKSHFTVDVLQSSDLSTLGWSEAHSATVNPTVNRPKSVRRRKSKHTACSPGSARRAPGAPSRRRDARTAHAGRPKAAG